MPDELLLLPHTSMARNVGLWLWQIPDIPGPYAYVASPEEWRILKNIPPRPGANWTRLAANELTPLRRHASARGASFLVPVHQGIYPEGFVPDLETYSNQRILLVGLPDALDAFERLSEILPLRLDLAPLPV